MMDAKVIDITTRRPGLKAGPVDRRGIQNNEIFRAFSGSITVEQYLVIERLDLNPDNSLRTCELLQDIPFEAEFSTRFNIKTRQAIITQADRLRNQFIWHLKRDCGFEDFDDATLRYLVDPSTYNLKRAFRTDAGRKRKG